MKVHHKIDSLPVFRNAVITIGTFDGVHTGHNQIIQQMKAVAASNSGETVIITFHPHPRKIVTNSSQEVSLLTTLHEKTALLDAAGIDHLVVVPFTEAFASLSANDYIEQFLVKRFLPHTLIIGYDHRFGKGRSGDFTLLESYAEKKVFNLVEIPEHLIQEAAVSSTRIRHALKDGDIISTNKLLGYPYFFEGTVTEGNKLGRTIGYPTANLQIEETEKLIPANGVYAVTVQLEQFSEKLNGMMNIGIRPTVGGKNRVVEVNIFDFDKDIYGKNLLVNVIAYIRAEQKFDGLDALKNQLANDKENAIRILGNSQTY